MRKFLVMNKSETTLIFAKRPEWNGTHFMPPRLVDELLKDAPQFLRPGQIWETLVNGKATSSRVNFWRGKWWQLVESN